MNKIIALENLKDISQSLKKFNCKHWLTDGTLLGYYRENNFIDHDHDTDIGVDWESFNKNALTDILAKGFVIGSVLGYVNDVGLEITLKRKNVRTDLFFFYKDKNNYFHSAYKNNTRIDYIYEWFDVKETVFLGESFYIPDDPLKFIETKYGKNWMIPNKKWSWAYSPLNHKKTNKTFNSIEAKKQFKIWFK
jgi:fukutin